MNKDREEFIARMNKRKLVLAIKNQEEAIKLCELGLIRATPYRLSTERDFLLQMRKVLSQ